MSHSDDLKDRPEGATAPEAVEKQPLGFEQTVAPADPSLTGRRLFLKLALFGAAASMIPETVLAAVQSAGGSPVALPYRNSLTFKQQQATLGDASGPESIYLVDGDGNLYIDAGGNVFLSNIQATGTFVSGNLNVGPISIVQPAASMAGKYVGTQLNASTTVLYSDRESQQQPAMLRLAGTLANGDSTITITVGFPPTTRPGGDIYVEVGWTKVTC